MIVLCCCTLLYVRSSITIILIGKRELVALLNLLHGVSCCLGGSFCGALGLSAVCNCGIS